jgi:hypothetical protein
MRLGFAALALLGACATLTAEQAPSLFMPEIVSTAASEWNAGVAQGGLVIFARSPKADFEGARILLVRPGARTATPISFASDAYIDTDPQLTPDGARLLFASNRPSRPGEAPKRDLDLWSARRTGDGWSTPEPLPVNSAGQELGPELHAGVLYFNSTRRGGVGALDIWRAARTPEGFAPPEPLPAPVNSPASEGDFTLSADARVALFWSDRPGGLGAADIYLSKRGAGGWSAPVNLGAPVNGAAFDFTPSLSRDGRSLYFASMRQPNGNADVYRIPVSAVPVLRAALRR